MNCEVTQGGQSNKITTVRNKYINIYSGPLLKSTWETSINPPGLVGPSVRTGRPTMWSPDCRV